MIINSTISRLIEKNIHWVKKRCIVSFCPITAITRCELRLAARLRNQNIIAGAGRLDRACQKQRTKKYIETSALVAAADADCAADCAADADADADQGGMLNEG